MKPTLEQLQERDLELEARKCADREGVTLEEMFSRSRLESAVEARRAFYRLLVDERGYSPYSISRFVGRNHATVLYALGLTAMARRRALARKRSS